jgi:hypothetical protein
MHQPIAAGKLLELRPNESEKAIDIGVKVTDNAEWQKVLDGTYTGFSVGGKYGKRWTDLSNPGMMRFTAIPQEISLVDAPAVPTATFALVKADGTVEQRPFKNVLPIEVAGAVYGDPPSWVSQFSGVIEKFASAVDLYASLRKMEAEDKEKMLQELQQRGSSVGIARRDGEPLTSPSGYPTDWKLYGDPANWSWPCDEKGRCQSAVAYYNGGRGKEKYSSREWAILGRRIARLAEAAFGVKYSFDPQDRRVERIEKMATPDLTKDGLPGLLGEVGAQLGQAADMIGSDPDGAKALLAQALAALKVAADTESAETGAASPHPPSSQTDVALAAAAAPPFTPSSSSSSTPPSAQTSGLSMTAASTPSTPSTPTDYASAYKAQLDAQAAEIAGLKDAVAKLLPAPAPVEKAAGDAAPAEAAAAPVLAQADVPVAPNIAPAPAPVTKAAPAGPLGDLNSLVTAQTPQDEALAILAAGGPNAYREAVRKAGSDQELQKRVTEAVVRSMQAGGIATAARFKVLDLGADGLPA